MKLRYSYDPDKWCLGTLCIHGHKWPGTELSLRRNTKRANRCAACSSTYENSLWLLKFVDLKASGVPDGFRLGKLCKAGHSWNNTCYNLRNKGGHCVDCERLIKERRSRHEAAVESGDYQSYLERSRERRAEYKRKRRANAGSRPQELVRLHAALRRMRRPPSVAWLVYAEQQQRWREHPQEKAEYIRWWSVFIYAWRYKCDPAFRRHECQRNSQRKAKNRGNHTVRLARHATATRFAEFGNRCAYCGTDTELIVEHFIPRSRGGPHTIGNIVPACHRCNISKLDHDPEQWYRSQPFFSQTRWRKILRVLGKSKSSVQQLPLL